jgi:hypothetical protein
MRQRRLRDRRRHGTNLVFSIGDKRLPDSFDQLKAPALPQIRPPLGISCAFGSDADVRVGPTRPGAAFGAPVTRIPASGLR